MKIKRYPVWKRRAALGWRVVMLFLAVLIGSASGNEARAVPTAGAAAGTERADDVRAGTVSAAVKDAAKRQASSGDHKRLVQAEPSERPDGEKEDSKRASASVKKKRPSGGNWAELQRQYRGIFVLRASSRGEKRVALTFDDVPDSRYTPLVLDVLKRKKVKATFFVVGSRARTHPALLVRINREGHAIGNHTYSHPELSRLSLGQVKTEIEKTGAVIRGRLGFTPGIIRPPYGEIGPTQLDWSKNNGYTVVNWDVDSSDWRQLSADKVFRNVTRTVRPGSIVLLHAGGGAGQNLSGSVNALPRLIDWLRANGYELVTVPELLRIPETRRTSLH